MKNPGFKNKGRYPVRQNTFGDNLYGELADVTMNAALEGNPTEKALKYGRLSQKEFGLSEEEFYNQMLADPASCFELTSEKE